MDNKERTERRREPRRKEIMATMRTKDRVYVRRADVAGSLVTGEVVVMLEEIARRIDNPRLLAPPKHARSLFMDGFKEMRLGWDIRI